jgi:hypothetical protein
MAIMWDESTKEFMCVKGFESTHASNKNNRNPEYTADWSAWQGKTNIDESVRNLCAL